MKKIFCFIAIAASLVSCDEDNGSTRDVSRTTYYPVVTLEGDDPAFVQAGDPYVDPGASGTINGEPVELSTQFVGRYRENVFTELDTNVADIYSLQYTAVNSDGFSSGASRQVIVAKTGDLVTSIEGLYTATTRRNGALLPASQGSSVDMKYILIWKNNDGSYGISDAFGGWYLLGRNIGASETPGGTIVANDIPSNNFSFPGGPLTNLYFGGTAYLTNVTVNPATKQVEVTCTWETVPPVTNYTFVMTLTQVQF